jgi:hypothetical protein
MAIKTEVKLPKGYDAYSVLHKMNSDLANELVKLTQVDSDDGVSETIANFNRHLITETVKYFNTREDLSK